MTELKTLKDIPMPLDCEGTLSRDDLKAEAVKWVKEDERCLKEGIEDEMVKVSTEARIDWIYTFFNLTEEDLEEKEE